MKTKKEITPTMIKDKEFLTVKEVATLFGCSRPTIYKLIKTGKLKAKNIGEKQTYIRRSDIDKLFD
ncbi:MAG: helix-turn-helix domain-containing protein [Sphingobacteriales bacterium]|jgi:excisionase family DNA binding protein|nr:helix-turn-helix domain-containing protein [Sphingobacteriales bacterium]